MVPGESGTSAPRLPALCLSSTASYQRYIKEIALALPFCPINGQTIFFLKQQLFLTNVALSWTPGTRPCVLPTL